MPTTLYVDPKRACVYVQVTGPFSDDAYVAAFKAVLAHPQRTADFAEVWDLLGSTRLDFTPQLLVTYTALIEAHCDVLTRGHIAVLARQEDVQAMTLLSEQIASRYIDRPIRLFRDAGQAETWLDLREGTFAFIKRENTAHIVATPGASGDGVRRA